MANKPEFVNEDPALIESTIIAEIEKATGQTLFPGDPKRLFIMGNSLIIAQERKLINNTGCQNLLSFVEGAYIDEYARNWGINRLEPKPATTTMKITLSQAQIYDITVPEGTRFTPDNSIFFESISDLIIKRGSLEGLLSAKCTITGIIGNDFKPGQINKTVDYFVWLKEAINVTTSAGGSDCETDEHLRERIQLCIERFSVAGPIGAYVYWAKTANQKIIDVTVWSPAPGCVEIRPLMENGEIPTQEILNSVYEIVNDKKVRPLTDYVTVLAPDVIYFDIEATYYIDIEKQMIGEIIKKEVEKALNNYILWQKTKLGRDINPSKLVYMIEEAGASRIAITCPDFTKVKNTQIAIAKNVNLVFGGYEND